MTHSFSFHFIFRKNTPGNRTPMFFLTRCAFNCRRRASAAALLPPQKKYCCSHLSIVTRYLFRRCIPEGTGTLPFDLNINCCSYLLQGTYYKQSRLCIIAVCAFHVYYSNTPFRNNRGKKVAKSKSNRF